VSGTERPQRPAPRAPIPPDAHEAPAVATASVERPAPAGTPEANEALAALRRMGASARALGLTLGFSLDSLAAYEAFERLEDGINRTVEEIAEVEEATLREAFTLFGADLEIDLSLTGLDPSFDPVSAELRAGQAPLRALADFRAAAEEVAATQGDSVSVDVQLRIGKSAALAQAQRLLAARAAKETPTEAPVSCVVFYSEAALLRLLSLGAASLWRQRGLGGDERRTLVALCEGSGYLAGVALEVIGAAGPAPDEWRTLTPQAWRRFARRVAQARKLRDDESAWSGLDLPFMPDHLRVTTRAPGLEMVAEQLAALRAAVAACALSSDLTSDSRAVTMRFAGTRPAYLRLDRAAPTRSSTVPLAPSTTDAEREPDEEPDALIALADWAYRDASPDRLAIARDALDGELPAATETTQEGVRAAAGPALNTARANLAVYLRQAAERYFQLRGAALAAINSYADATRKAVTDLTSDMVDNLFKTVGLFVGVIIAGLIEPTASRPVATLATIFYIAYVAFIMWFLLRARYARYELEGKALDSTLNAMSELTEDERRKLREPAAQANTHFERYYRITCYTYLALALLGVLALILIQTPLWHALAPASTPMPTATPAR
jgi:hypothetical protein